MSYLNQNANRIKQLIVVMAAAVFVLKASAAAAGPLGRQLVELESHIKWSAVDNAWKRMRPDWVSTTAGCAGPECAAEQMLELEAHVKWKAVEGAWTKRRAGWVHDCKAATTAAEVSALLLEFEENIRWQAVDENWKERRDGWVAAVKGD